MSEADVVTRRLRAHWKKMAANRPLWERMSAAADNELWTSGYPAAWKAMLTGGETPDPLPIRVQVNLLRPWLSKQVAMLYLRTPRCTATPPMVHASVGRARNAVNPDVVNAVKLVCEQWLVHNNIREIVEQAMESALLYPGAALRMGWRDDSEIAPLDRPWLSNVPRWNAMWDERAESIETMNYLGHLRWVPVEQARDMFGGGFDEETRPIADYLRDTEVHRLDAEDLHDDQFVQLLDWWDIQKRTWCHYVVSRDGDAVRELASADVPYRLPSGMVFPMLRPIVLANSVGLRWRPVSLAQPIYEQGAEKSLILSFVVNAFRRDSARVVLYMKENGVPDEDITKILNAIDMEFVGVTPQKGVELAKMFHGLVMPDISRTLGTAYQWLSQAGAEGSAMSPVGQGSSGMQYAAATLVQSMSAADAAVATAPANRMNQILGELCQGMLVMMAQELGGLRVTVGGEPITITKDLLRLRWDIKVEDSTAAAAIAQGRRAELVQVAPLYVNAVVAASPQPGATGWWSGPPVPGGPAPAAAPEVPVEVVAANQRLVDLIAETWDFPAWMRWPALEQVRREKERSSKPDDRAAEFMPPMPVPPPMPPIEAPPVDPMAAAGPSMDEGAAVDQLAATIPPDQLDALLATLGGG